MSNEKNTVGRLLDDQFLSLQQQLEQMQAICNLQQQEIEKLYAQLCQTRQSLGMEALPSVIEQLPECETHSNEEHKHKVIQGSSLTGQIIEEPVKSSVDITIFVIPDNDIQGIVLMEVPDYNSEGAQMCMTYEEGGTSATVTFNSGYEVSYLSYLEDFIIPFFEVQQVCHSTPMGVETIKPGLAIFNGENWILKEKPIIKIV